MNLASNEYFNSVKPTALDVEVISPVFKDFKNGKYKIISFYAKKARGLMADFIIRNRLRQPRDLQDFNLAGYRYDGRGSIDGAPLFLRKNPV